MIAINNLSTRFMGQGKTSVRSRAHRSVLEPRSARRAALQERLPSLLVFELDADGGRRYLDMSVRGLYKYVIKSITQSSAVSGTKPDEGSSPKQDEEPVSQTLPEAEVPTLALGHAVVGHSTPASPSAARRATYMESVANLQSALKDNAPLTAVTYRERLGGYLHPRDMRRLVTPFSTTNEPELIVRRHVMLLNFDPLRAIILRDRLLLLVPDGADEILETLEQRLRGGYKAVENELFGESGDADASGHPFKKEEEESEEEEALKQSRIKNFAHKILKPHSFGDSKAEAEKHSKDEPSTDDDGSTDSYGVEQHEWEDLEGRDWINLPFELQSVEAVLFSVTAILAGDAYELQEEANVVIDYLLGPGGAAVSESAPELLRGVKDEIKEMISRVNGFVRAMNLILDDDEDMALMNLSRLITHPERFIQPVDPRILSEESDEPELILEGNLQQGLSVNNAMELIVGQIESTEELIKQKSDTVRNRLLYINMVISFLSLVLACGSLVGSFFGMNLVNGWEDDPDAFQHIVIGTLVGCFGVLLLLILVVWYAGTLPSGSYKLVVAERDPP